MKVAILTTSYPASAADPAGHFVQAEARALARQGHEVVVLSPGPAQAETGIRHVRVAGASLFGWPGALERLKGAPWRLPHGAAFVASARLALARLGPVDQVIAHWLVPCGWPAAVGFKPLTVVAHGSDVRLLTLLPAAVSRRILRHLLSAGVSIRCVSRALAQQLSKLCPELEPATSVQPCRIELRGVPSRAQAQSQLGVAEERLIVMVGRLVRSKRTHVALAASQLLPKSRVVVVGDGPLLSELRACYPHAHFLGALPRDQTLLWIAAADVLLSASLEEGAPTAIREALRLGVDVVSCPVGDLETWAGEEPGLWIIRGPQAR